MDIFIYANVGDLRGTLYSESDAWVAGHANGAVGVVMVVIEPGANQSIAMEQRIPHELMHVMLYRSIGPGYNNLPAWLREGPATLAEVSPNSDYDRVLAAAGANNTLIPIKDLWTSFSPNADTLFSYAESRSLPTITERMVPQSVSLVSIYADGVDCEHGTENAMCFAFKAGDGLARIHLGQTPSAALQICPLFGLLCFDIIDPIHGILSVMRKKGSRNEPESLPDETKNRAQHMCGVKGRVQAVGFRAHVEYSGVKLVGSLAGCGNVAMTPSKDCRRRARESGTIYRNDEAGSPRLTRG